MANFGRDDFRRSMRRTHKRKGVARSGSTRERRVDALLYMDAAPDAARGQEAHMRAPVTQACDDVDALQAAIDLQDDAELSLAQEMPIAQNMRLDDAALDALLAVDEPAQTTVASDEAEYIVDVDAGADEAEEYVVTIEDEDDTEYIVDIDEEEDVPLAHARYGVSEIDRLRGEIARRSPKGQKTRGGKRRSIRPKRSVARRVAMTAASMLVLVALLAGGLWAGKELTDPTKNLVQAKAVYFDGIPVGTVADGEELEGIVDGIYADLSQEYGVDVLNKQQLVLEEKLVDPRFIAAPEDVGNAVRKNIDVQVHATVLMVDGLAAVAVSSKDEAEWVLAQVKAPYALEGNADVQFAEKVAIEERDINYAMLKSKEEALQLLTTGVDKVVPYTVKSGDTISQIAKDNNLTVADLRAANAAIANTDNLDIGMTLNLIKPQNLVNVTYTKQVTTVSALPFETQTQDSANLYEGETKVQQEGAEGERQLVETVSYINNVEVGRATVSDTVTREPVAKIILKGTKQKPVSKPSGGSSGNATSKPPSNNPSASGFIWPVGGGSISSGFGSRWGSFHYGIDIAAPAGTAVYASKAGTVVRTTSGWGGGYGNMVEIDHGNGVRTRYAHNSANLVSVGQQVAQGQQIAKVGSTGDSTGNHCHFEIRINGTAVNPTSYL
nr:M23 family metallopeptidase [Maliibacterium massiliense]